MDRRKSLSRVARAWNLWGVVHLLALFSLVLASPHLGSSSSNLRFNLRICDRQHGGCRSACTSRCQERRNGRCDHRPYTDDSGFYNVTHIIAGLMM